MYSQKSDYITAIGYLSKVIYKINSHQIWTFPILFVDFIKQPEGYLNAGRLLHSHTTIGQSQTGYE